MPPVLQNIEASFLVDGRVQSRFPSTQRLPVQTTIAEFIRRGGGFVSVLSRLSNSGKLGIDLRRTPDSKAILLHKPSFPGCESKIPNDKKTGFCLDRRIKEASSLLPGAHDTSHDRPTIVKGYG